MARKTVTKLVALTTKEARAKLRELGAAVGSRGRFSQEHRDLLAANGFEIAA